MSPLPRHRRAWPAGLVIAAALVVVPAAPVQATYPGSTDGRLAYGIRIAGNVDIYTSLENGQALRRLTSAPSFDACPAYAPNGKWIAYCSNASGAFEIWAMKANGTEQHQVTAIGGRMLFPDVSPSGARIAFSGGLGDELPGDIYSIRSDGTGLVQLTTDPTDDLYPAWSPDGTTIAFISARTGSPQVWLMDADGGHQRQLTTDPLLKDQVPDWRPDGARLAYSAGAPDSPADLYTIRLDGSGVQQLTASPADDDFAPAWSPDGRAIAYVSTRSDGRFVHVIAADGSTDSIVNDDAGPQFAPAWQPLGDRG